MDQPKEIPITQSHIDRGMDQGASSCPIALAIREELDRPYATVSVTQNWIRIGENGVVPEGLYENGIRLAQWIENLDNHKYVAPFTLVLTPGTGNNPHLGKAGMLDIGRTHVKAQESRPWKLSP